MSKRILLVGAMAVLMLGGAAWVYRGQLMGERAAAQAPAGPRPVLVQVAKAVKGTVPARLEALGNVTTMASVAIKPRVDSEIIGVQFADGALVKQGAVLFTFDGRQIEADIRRVQAVIDGAEAQLQQALRDVKRYTELADKNAVPIVTLNNSQTQVNVSRALAESNRATLESLKVQLGFCTIRAPISGRISMASVKVGNIVRQADTAPLATINQVAPIYISFTIPQRNLPDVRQALAAETATLEALVPGSDDRATGQVTMIENTVDPATGMVIIRATMPNTDELLWPGTLVNTRLTLRHVEGVKVPEAALQFSQSGAFVFVVKGDTVAVRPVKVDRTVDGEALVASGLEEGEVVVTDGQLQLSNGSRVTIRNKAGS